MSDELPDINVSRGEKALAAVLVIFLLIGGLWVYFVPLDRDAKEVAPTAQEQRAIDAFDSADARQLNAVDRRDQRERTYERAREEYRTDLDAGSPGVASKRAFETARDRSADATRAPEAASAEVRRLEPAANRAQDAVSKRQQ